MQDLKKRLQLPSYIQSRLQDGASQTHTCVIQDTHTGTCVIRPTVHDLCEEAIFFNNRKRREGSLKTEIQLEEVGKFKIFVITELSSGCVGYGGCKACCCCC